MFLPSLQLDGVVLSLNEARSENDSKIAFGSQNIVGLADAVANLLETSAAASYPSLIGRELH